MYNPTRVFLDTEFTDFHRRDLISIGLYIDDKTKFYAENQDFIKSWSSSWVQHNIYPLLSLGALDYPRKELKQMILKWIEQIPNDQIIISADYNGDLELFYDLLEQQLPNKIILMENTYISIPIICDIEFYQQPEKYDFYYHKIMGQYKEIVDNYFITHEKVRHHALNDAGANHYAWNKLETEFPFLKNNFKFIDIINAKKDLQVIRTKK